MKTIIQIIDNKKKFYFKYLFQNIKFNKTFSKQEALTI